MKSPRVFVAAGILLALFVALLVVASSAATAPQASAQSGGCTATGPSLEDARDAYAAACSAPRVDCDEIDGMWTCSSETIGDKAPGDQLPGDQAPGDGSAATPSPVPTAASPLDGSIGCTATGASLDDARDAYAAACSAPRIDCDEIDGTWTCSSIVLGDKAPESATPTTTPTNSPGPTASPDPTPTSPTSPPILDPDPTPTSGPIAAPTTSPDPTPTSPVATPASPTPTAEPAPADEPTPTVAPTPFTPLTPEPTTVELTFAAQEPTPVDGPTIEQTYPTTSGPDRNPLKGWNSGWSDDRPETTVGFQYIKWSDFEPTNGAFDYAAVEEIFARAGSQDRHLIVRLYCDWWGETEASRGCPEWIYSEVGVDRIEGDNGRFITDYNDPRYIDQAIQAIEALGARYDDDPRMFTVQLGVLGYWGEWHTWGSQVDGSPYEISPRTEARILNAYLDAFDRVPVAGRQPGGQTLAASDQIGFHNDYFRPDNDHSTEFDDAVAAEMRWTQGPIGGEMPPGLSDDEYVSLYATSQGRDMIERGGYSTMKPSAVASDYTDTHLALHRRFGYSYQIETARFSSGQDQSDQTPVSLTVKNVGIAPFYFDWQVQFALIDTDGTVAATAEAAGYDLRAAGPDEVFELAGVISNTGVDPGDYRLGVRIVQPGAELPKTASWGLAARNTYVLFANELDVINGSWSSTNELIGGWSILGITSVN